MSEHNKRLAYSWVEALSRHDAEGVLAAVTDDFVNHHSTLQGRDGLREELAYWYAAFPDLSVTVEDLIAEGDRVVARVASKATHGGDFMGTPPTHRQINVEEIDIFRIENGRIAEIWPMPDIATVLVQIGALDNPDQDPDAG